MYYFFNHLTAPMTVIIIIVPMLFKTHIKIEIVFYLKSNKIDCIY